MDTNQTLKQYICEIGKLMYDRGYVVSNDGNISVRTAENTVIITPSGVGKGRMAPDMLVTLDMDGNILEGDRYPSSEVKMHIEVYRARPEVMGVVHAHPPLATSFAIAHKPLDIMYMPEMALALGTVPCTEYATPSTKEVPDSIKPFVGQGNNLLLANHGVLSWGTDVWKAFDFLEVVEYTAKMYLTVQQIGGGVTLTQKQLDDLDGLRGNYAKLASQRDE